MQKFILPKQRKNVFSISGEEKCYLVTEPRIALESVFALDII